MELTITEMAEILHTTVKAPLTRRLARRHVSLSTDSRSIGKNKVFWALKGDRFDGHEYVGDCFSRGAWAAVVNKGWKPEGGKPSGIYLEVQDTTDALLELAEVYAGKFDIPKISLTGSNGKTATKEMLLSVLSRAGKAHGTKGNLNNHIGVPLTLFGLRRSHRYAVVEMGTNHPGEIAPLARAVRADIGIITNVGHSHTEFLKSPEGVYREKKNITRGFHKHSVLIVNADDKYLSRLEGRSKYRVISFGIDKGSLRVRKLRMEDDGCASFSVGRTRFKLKVPGKHNVYNALAAIAAGRKLGISMGEMAKSLGRFTSSGRRLEVKHIKGIRVYDDCYNANPSSMAAGLEVLGNSRNKGRRLAVLGDMKELGTREKQLHYQLGRQLAKAGVNEFYGLGKLIAETGRGARDAGMSRASIHVYEELSPLKRALGRKLRPGDALLIKGSRSMRLERVTDFLEKKWKVRGA